MVSVTDPAGCRCELSYTPEESPDRHEEWLLEWTLAWMDAGVVEAVEIGRTDVDGATGFEVVIDSTLDCETLRSREVHERLLGRLTERIDRPAVSYRPAGVRDRCQY